MGCTIQDVFHSLTLAKHWVYVLTLLVIKVSAYFHDFSEKLSWADPELWIRKNNILFMDHFHCFALGPAHLENSRFTWWLTYSMSTCRQIRSWFETPFRSTMKVLKSAEQISDSNMTLHLILRILPPLPRGVFYILIILLGKFVHWLGLSSY